MYDKAPVPFSLDYPEDAPVNMCGPNQTHR